MNLKPLLLTLLLTLSLASGAWGATWYVDKTGIGVGLTSDYRGRTVPLNGIPDIGAYEGRGRAIMLPDGTFLGYQP